MTIDEVMEQLSLLDEIGKIGFIQEKSDHDISCVCIVGQV
jgi:hypothetical protein